MAKAKLSNVPCEVCGNKKYSSCFQNPASHVLEDSGKRFWDGPKNSSALAFAFRISLRQRKTDLFTSKPLQPQRKALTLLSDN